MLHLQQSVEKIRQKVPESTFKLYLLLYFTVITLREHQNDTGVAIVCFMEHLEEYQIEEMEKLLQNLEITEKSAARPNSLLDSNLYI